MTHNFTRDLSTDKWDIKIDTEANYGYFERHSDGEGGGLWFARNDDNGEIELIDFDGVYELAPSIIKALRGAGYFLDTTFNKD